MLFDGHNYTKDFFAPSYISFNNLQDKKCLNLIGRILPKVAFTLKTFWYPFKKLK